jgi:CHAT domain-containing protein
LIYETPELGDLIWSPLEEYLTGVQNIYFAPTGIMHNLAIEYLPTHQGPVQERFKLYRLSSTRQLAMNPPVNRQEKTVLYGGLDYNNTLADSSSSTKAESSSGNVNRQLINELMRSGIAAKPLPGTQREVEQISQALSKQRIRPAMLTGVEGTESSLKALSGQKINRLHIATHGFYMPEKDVPESFQFLTADLDEKAAAEDRSLSRSGLLMAGANVVLSGDVIPDGKDDGILTSKEIAQLDLRDLDLVALSACQTGLGEVTGEGVFGLQRGFKKAGAQTLLMSLWSVNDQATEIMMTRFYHYLIAGKSKRESFLSAQNDLRNYEEEVSYEREDRSQSPVFDARRGIRVYPKMQVTEKRKIFDKPQYWAAFILLD